MPPRVHEWSHTAVSDEVPTCKYPPLAVSSGSRHRHHRESRTRPRLRLGTHGWSGVASTVLTSAAILVARCSSSLLSDDSHRWLSSLLSLSAAGTAAVTASSGIPLVNQAPVCTVIARNVVPPHRDAFRRTAKTVYYLSARIVWNHMRWVRWSKYSGNADGVSFGVLDWAWGCAALLYAIKHFLPRIQETEWRNGNTYVFVVPMASGIIADAVFQLPLVQCQMMKADSDGIARNSCWNRNAVNETDLLCVLLSALFVAFMFTLAFRGTLDIKRCYWGSAAVVHGICWYLFIKALPFVVTSLHSLF